MPILGKQNITRIYLPSTENEPNEEDRAWVDMKDKIFLKDMIEILKGKTAEEQGLYGLAQAIVDWNYTDEAGVKKPIDIDTVAELENSDFNILVSIRRETEKRAQAGLSDDEKKDSSSTSTPGTTVETPKA